MSAPMLDELFNHLVLPPRLPGVQKSIAAVENALLDRLQSTATKLREQVHSLDQASYETLRSSLETCRTIHVNRNLDRRNLSEALLDIQPNHVLTLHITEQNAGLLIWLQSSPEGEHVVFEAFEASPRSEDVLAAEGALEYDFPGSAIAIPHDTYTDPNFQLNLARFLEQASREPVSRFANFARKAGQSVVEERQPANPDLISHCFVTLLEALGRHAPEVPRFRKRIHDNICWHEAKLPFRRLPLWLVLRVGLRRQFHLLFGDKSGRVHYKFFIASLLSGLLADLLCRSDFDHQNIAFLNAKVARRLSKLEDDKVNSSTPLQETYQKLFDLLGPSFLSLMTDASKSVHGPYETFKSSVLRIIPKLPTRMIGPRLYGQDPFFLTLPNSRQYLNSVPTGEAFSQSQKIALNYDSVNLGHTAPSLISSGEPDKGYALKALITMYTTLSDREMELRNRPQTVPSTIDDCIEIARLIEDYVDRSESAYQSNPEMMSAAILLLMELWMHMDICAVQVFPLLKDFNPGFSAHIFKVLQLPLEDDMLRLQKVQAHLDARLHACEASLTIFDDPSQDCFAARWFDASIEMQMIQEKIEADAEVKKKEKVLEHERVKVEYDQLLRDMAGMDCTTTTAEDWPHELIHNPRRCGKCSKDRQSRNKRIEPLEHPLPRHSHEAKVAIFELNVPVGFAAYRDATWKIISKTARATPPAETHPQIFLLDYPRIRPYQVSNGGKFCLASRTKISAQTHRNTVHVCRSLDQFFVSCGLELRYYDDGVLKNWMATTRIEPSIAHHCNILLSGPSPFASLLAKPEFAAGSKGSGSNEVLASEPDCPQSINVHEYLQFQMILSSTHAHTKWDFILLQLASSTLNFSNEATSSLIQHVSSQAGPVHGDDPTHHLRATHIMFEDDTFCDQLMELLESRLTPLHLNWRETHSVSMILTILLRVHSLGAPVTAKKAFKLIQEVRSILSRWNDLLSEEIRTAKAESSAQVCVKYAFQVAILGRRTFSVFRESYDEVESTDHLLDVEALVAFISFSVALQNNCPNPQKLSRPLKAALVRDLKLIYSLRQVIRKAFEHHPQCLAQAFNTMWPNSDRQCSAVRFLGRPNQGWCEMKITNPSMRSQSVMFHILEGHLRLDGQGLGRLSEKIRQQAIIQELFGDTNLHVYPSPAAEMTHVLTVVYWGNEVHIGTRGSHTIVRTYKNGVWHEMVPTSIFKCADEFSGDPDLPSNLIDGSVAWLNLASNTLEIRKGNFWMSKESNWVLDLRTRTATRYVKHKFLTKHKLVDPRSDLARKVARMFHGFEYPRHITVYYPTNGPFYVEIKRLELQFRVNNGGFLESPELNMEIDKNQDAGCLYGLRSSIVVRERNNKSNRSVLVPLLEKDGLSCGQPQYCIHVHSWIAANGTYIKYTVNDVLGCLSSPMEPAMIYQLAMMHAVTSFLIPDQLTGQTGSEQALRILTSAYAAPCMPLPLSACAALDTISRLSPTREYYPPDLRVQEKTTWSARLTTQIQRDEYHSLVNKIYQSSDDLLPFYPTAPRARSSNISAEGPSVFEETAAHLTRRAYLRRHQFERPNPFSEIVPPSKLLHYRSRHVLKSSRQRSEIFEIVDLIQRWPSNLRSTRDLATMLERWDQVGGFDRTLDPTFSINACIDVKDSIDFGAITSFCSKAQEQDKYTLAFVFSLFSLGRVTNETLRIWLAFAFFKDIATLPAPQYQPYQNFRRSQIPQVDMLVSILRRAAPQATEQTLPVHVLNTIAFEREQRIEVDNRSLAEHLLPQWPSLQPDASNFHQPTVLSIENSMRVVVPEWTRLYQNLQLAGYVRQVQHILDVHDCEETSASPSLRQPSKHLSLRPSNSSGILCLSRDLLSKSDPPRPSIAKPVQMPLAALATKTNSVQIFKPTVLGRSKGPFRNGLIQSTPVPQDRGSTTLAKIYSQEIQNLRQIIEGVAASPMASQYAKGLMASVDAYAKLEQDVKQTPQLPTLDQLIKQLAVAEQSVNERYARLCVGFESGQSQSRWLKAARIWPSESAWSLLESLRSTSSTKFGKGMKQALVEYALSLTQHQRLLRMIDALRKLSLTKLAAEHENSGHGNWQPEKHPDWLLFELDANVLLRAEQVTVARATINPHSGKNSLMQLNMGRGKTSVILPIVSAHLANSENLMRVVCTRPLIPQTASLLLSRIGGLVGRQVKHIPFSRKIPTDRKTIETYYSLHKAIRKAQGVVLTAPEHLLSFKLCGLQRLSDVQQEEAVGMINVQNWLTTKARDVVDESDFIFSTRTALVFPSGNLSVMDGSDHRWQTAEELLKIVHRQLWQLQQRFPQSIEIIDRNNQGFPFVFFLKPDVENALISGIVADILSGKTGILPTSECSVIEKNVVKEYISSAIVPDAAAQEFQKMWPDNPELRKKVLLLRGLLVHRILLLTLKKRWNIQYGIDPRRFPIAVPFHAKSTPSEMSEYGHADVAISLTILAHYYQGLDRQQVRQNLEQVGKSDDCQRIFEGLIQNITNFPDALRRFESLNLDDEFQVAEIFKATRFDMAFISYHLNAFVFPRHAKQFSVKLQASAWDLGLHSGRTTGFSGTHDNRDMLPRMVEQQDLPELAHTSAEVLSYLLQPRNRSYILATNHHGRRLSEEDLLRTLKSMGIRILIDTGALVLEMTNEETVRCWLQIDESAPAAVYFDDSNKPFVRFRGGRFLPLSATPFVEDLSGLLVYISEAHTRGTDLKLPARARAALTLGVSLQKDALTQGAMRMRNLGTTQSVVFVAPPEIHQSIVEVAKLRPRDQVDSSHVIQWLLNSTCQALESLFPLFYSYGLDYCERTQAALDYPNFLYDPEERKPFLGIVRQKEKRTLKAHYEPKSILMTKKSDGNSRFNSTLTGYMKALNKGRRAFQDSNNAVHASALEEVEQEREIETEVAVEQVRLLQRPPRFHPHRYEGLNRDILRFVNTGRLSARSAGYEQAFEAMKRTAVGRKFGISQEALKSPIYSSMEFSRTVLVPYNRPCDSYLRPVQFVLYSTVSDTALLVSPEEAEVLIRRCREQEESNVHLVVYSAPITRTMASQFSNLDLHATPPFPADFQAPIWLLVLVGLIAGRLYFEWEEYKYLKDFLGLADEDEAEGPELVPESDDTSSEEGGSRAVEDGDVPDSAVDGSENKPGELSGGGVEAKVTNKGIPVAEVKTKQSAKEETKTYRFTAKPRAFLHAWTAARRKNEDFQNTPIGFVIEGKPLKRSHPFFKRNDGETVQKMALAGGGREDEDEEDDHDEDGFMFEDVGEGDGGAGVFDADAYDFDEEEDSSSQSEMEEVKYEVI